MRTLFTFLFSRRETATGALVATGSETGLFGSKSLRDYSATKGAIHAFTRSLASNLAKKGIRVDCVAPGQPSY